jgi:4-hydroxy-tetrahydrodipicolinate reductase
MGRILIRCIQRAEDMELAAAVERDDHPELGADAGELAGLPAMGVAVTLDLQEALQGADVLIDFTLHAAVPGNVAIAAGLRKPAVIGTTGLNDDETAVVRDAAERIPIVWAPNMSLGINLLFAMVGRAAEILGTRYAVEIDETHHVHKKDAPSGTAIRLGEKAAAGRGLDPAAAIAHDPGGAGNIHDAGKVVIRSHREDEVVGDHTVAFGSATEKVEFTHHAWSRDAFALGALRAAQWILGRSPGLYDMQDVLGL